MDNPERMTTAEAAAYLGMSRQHLYNLRSRGEGPTSYKLGGKLTYDKRDLDLWIAQQKAATMVGGAA